MKYSIAVKFLAVFLCALSLVAIAGSAIGILSAEEFGLYSNNPTAWKQNEVWALGRDLAYSSARLYAAEHLGDCPEAVLEALREESTDSAYSTAYLSQVSDDMWSVTISQDGRVLQEGNAGLEDADAFHYEILVHYPTVGDDTAPAVPTVSEPVYETGTPSTTMPANTAPDSPTAPVMMQKSGEEAADSNLSAYAANSGGIEWSEYLVVKENAERMRTVRLDYHTGPTYNVTLYLQTEKVSTRFDTLTGLLFSWRFKFITILLVGLLLFAVSTVYLCWASGKKAGSAEIVPAGLNRLPLDLYALCVVLGCLFLVIPAHYLLNYITQNGYSPNLWLAMGIGALCVFAVALLLTGFLFALSAQVKIRNGYWWRHSILGWCLHQIGRALRWIGRGFRLVWHGIRAVIRLMPLIWQWVTAAICMIFFTTICFMGWLEGRSDFFALLTLLDLCACLAIVCYAGYCFGTLQKGIQAMAQGDLNHQISTRHLRGSFKDFALGLNSLAGAAQLAAQRQMKSERMKTELITNVSHDIKTPLTSIINYVDLLKKPHNESDGVLYLEVLDRQSQRLKKLIDDLMEMSKASTGNLPVELARLDAVEAVNQALGEFADKLASAKLTPVFRYPDTPVTMLADGRLVWRVLSNLLSNAVKYAMPDTRLYIDLMVLQGNAVIAIKNISRDQLNVNADELMERFVRGDSSRNTEGSGLGLNIAKSLVELQRGQMHLMVDGDLFKVTLIFPCA